MELKDYSKKTKPAEIEMKGGDKVLVNYYVNYLTIPVIEELNKMSDAGALTYDYNVSQLTHMLESIDLTMDGVALPFGTSDEKSAALKNLSYDDIAALVVGIQRDLEGETKNDSTGSADG